MENVLHNTLAKEQTQLEAINYSFNLKNSDYHNFLRRLNNIIEKLESQEKSDKCEEPTIQPTELITLLNNNLSYYDTNNNYFSYLLNKLESII